MNYGKGNWPILDQALHKKAVDYDKLVKGIIHELSSIDNIFGFCKEAGLSDSNLDRIVAGQTKPRLITILRIIKALVIQRNYYRAQLKNLRHGI